MSQLDLFRAPHRRLMPTAAPDSMRSLATSALRQERQSTVECAGSDSKRCFRAAALAKIVGHSRRQLGLDEMGIGQ